MWQIRSEAPLESIAVTSQERGWAAELTPSRSQRFLASRSWIRSCLAVKHGVQPLQVPLEAPPGAPPQLQSGWGYVSLSHCADACLLGWSQQPIGVDLERCDRAIPSAFSLIHRFFTRPEQIELRDLKGEQLRQEFLNRWLLKEAAIKWQQGSLAQDLRFWQVCPTRRIACHHGLNLKVTAQLRSVKTWRLGVVVAEEKNLQDCLLCLT